MKEIPRARGVAFPLAASVVLVAWLSSTVTAQPIGTDWTTYHFDAQRSGVMAGASVSTTPGIQWQSPTLDGDIYAEPLYVGGHALVVTENDTAYALDGQSGQVLWSTHLGEPVPARTLPCGNIDPVGMTSTPVADPSAGVVYMVAFSQPAHHELYALSLSDGSIRFHQPIDPPGADPHTHLQRAALALSQGRVYVSFGGRFGDCGAYHGWVIAASASDGSTLAVYQVPTQREGAIWATGGPSLDAQGNLFVATGNAGSGDFDFGNAVIKLSPDLQVVDWWAPSDWAALSQRDADVGSTSPLLLNGGLVFQIGKSGVGYLLRQDGLGNIGGQAFSGQVCGGAYGSLAYADPYVYVACRDGLVAVQVQDGPSFSVVWRALNAFANPPIVVGSTVWTIGRDDGRLYGLSAADGSTQFQSSPPPNGSKPPRFVTPGFGDGRVLAILDRTIAAFGP